MEEKLLVLMDIVNITALSGAIVAMGKSIKQIRLPYATDVDQKVMKSIKQQILRDL